MPEKAIYSIENLSEIMSYMLYETTDERVPLEAEINYMRNYLKLQEVRYSPGYVAFEVSGETCGLMVPPLLFMPFLENTFSTAQADSSKIPGITITLHLSSSLSPLLKITSLNTFISSCHLCGLLKYQSTFGFVLLFFMYSYFFLYFQQTAETPCCII